MQGLEPGLAITRDDQLTIVLEAEEQVTRSVDRRVF
jgi:hypothetical protein